jgi:mono/diheme cytochrome c family protein
MSHLRVALALAGAIWLVHPTANADETSFQLKEATGRNVVSAYCSICHSLDYIPMNAPVMTSKRWEITLRKMIEKMGAPIDAASAGEIQKYLSTQYAQALE